MRRKHIAPLVVLMLVAGAFLYAASGRMSHSYLPIATLEPEPEPAVVAAPQKKAPQRGMVDMVADDSYLIDKGDSTIFILVGNFAAHHNGAVILADSAVRYANQSFECFGNVLINQNTTYIYGERAQYNHITCVATIYDDLVKVVDGEAVMYTYHCSFDTYDEVGEFSGGCFVEKGASLMESERGYYNTKTHDLIAVDNVEMRDDTYQMTGDSVIFNTETENAHYFTNTNIWNDKDEYLYADEGEYTKLKDLHHLMRNAYILSPEHEIWSDTIEYYRTEGHIIGRRNIQIDDTTQKILGFADYGEWWDNPGNAFFTRRPSMINYDPDADSLFLCADTLWMYTISAAPKPAEKPEPVEPSEAEQSEKTSDTTKVERQITDSSLAGRDDMPVRDSLNGNRDVPKNDKRAAEKKSAPKEKPQNKAVEQNKEEEQKKTTEEVDNATESATSTTPATLTATVESSAESPVESSVDIDDNHTVEKTVSDEQTSVLSTVGVVEETSITPESAGIDRRRAKYEAKRVADSLKSLERANAKAQKAAERALKDSLERVARAERDSLLAIERAVQDSIMAIEQAERDSIQAIKDSILRIKIDTIIAERRAKNIRIAEAEKERIERIKQKVEERRRRKIDKAKARALKRGKEYKGEDYTIDSLAADSVASEEQMNSKRDMRDTMQRDSLATDSLAQDSVMTKPEIPADSVYKLIKAYRNVKMYTAESQMVCDSLTTLNTDSVIRLYRSPVMWNEKNQITADSIALYTTNQTITKAHFMGDPIMGTEIDTMYYNQVKGKDMVALFRNGSVYRNDVDGNAQTIYYMQEEEGSTDVTGFMYIESAGITFYLNDNGEMDKITYRQNPEYVLYPMDMIPETQERTLPDFKWRTDKRPLRDSVVQRSIRPTRREDVSSRKKPTFPITERINYDRRRLVENRMWVDRLDLLSPEVEEWRNSRTSYKK